MKTINTIKKLVKNECSGYFQDGYCCSRDNKCIFFCSVEYWSDNPEEQNEDDILWLPRCAIFEKRILPIVPDLRKEYYKERELKITKKELKSVRLCKSCGKVQVFGKQQHCASCKKQLAKISAKKSMQKKRGQC